MNYWVKRAAENQLKLSDKTIKEINKQIQYLYGTAAKKVISDFESTYDKLLATLESGKKPTPADLYKLDKYWQMQAKLRDELKKLGDKEIQILSKAFEEHYLNIYNTFAIPGSETFRTLDIAAVQQIINSVWVADGKVWSERIWSNTEKLAATLTEELTNIVAAGKKHTDLVNVLQERFNVSYHRAQTLVRTEIAHIQTEAARQRYEDYGIDYVEVLVDADDHTCELCKALQGKRFSIYETPPLPVHPNERCCLVPVVDI